MSLVVGIGTGEGCSYDVQLSVDFGDIEGKLDPCRVELFANSGCLGLLMVPLDGALHGC